jgi:uncharacterized membrane protein
MNFFLEISVISSTLLSSLLAIKKNYQTDFFLFYPILFYLYSIYREREREGKEEISISTEDEQEKSTERDYSSLTSRLRREREVQEQTS